MKHGAGARSLSKNWKKKLGAKSRNKELDQGVGTRN